MPLFVAVHKWKIEDLSKVTRKVIEVLQQIPEGTCLCCSYIDVEQTGAWFVGSKIGRPS